MGEFPTKVPKVPQDLRRGRHSGSLPGTSQHRSTARSGCFQQSSNRCASNLQPFGNLPRAVPAACSRLISGRYFWIVTGRPWAFPALRAAATPARTRSCRMSCSKAANTERMPAHGHWGWSYPAPRSTTLTPAQVGELVQGADQIQYHRSSRHTTMQSSSRSCAWRRAACDERLKDSVGIKPPKLID